MGSAAKPRGIDFTPLSENTACNDHSNPPNAAFNPSEPMTESQIIEVTSADWHGGQLSIEREQLLAGVERGKVLYFPNLQFPVIGGEKALLDPKIADPARKNISLGANGGALAGVLGDAVTQSAVRALIGRYQQNAQTLID